MYNQLDPSKNFKVSQMIVFQTIVGVLMLMLGLYFLFEPHSFKVSSRYYILIFMVFIFPGLVFIIRAMVNQTVILINKAGIYSFGRLITTWQNYIGAYVKQEPPAGSLSDCEVLYIQYKKPNKPGSFVRILKLGNTQNKASEEIIEAIEFYYNNFKQSNPV